MNCSCVCIFKDEADRKNIEMYQKLAELILRMDDDIYPDCLAVSKRSDKFWRTYDEARFTKKERKEPYDKACQSIEGYIQRIKEKNEHAAIFEGFCKCDIHSDELETIRDMFFIEVAYGLNVRYRETINLREDFLTYCTTFKEYYFKTNKDDVFMWVSGKYGNMKEQKLMDVAETPEEKEIASKVLFGFNRHVKEGYWFNDLKEPKLPSWSDKYEYHDAV